MVIAIDIGNTNLHLGRFRDRRLIRVLVISSRGRIHWARIRSFLSSGAVSRVVLASVQPRLDRPLKALVRSTLGLTPLVVDHRHPSGLKLGYERPWTLGADRIAGAAGALALFRRHAIVVSFGTAITVDAVMKNGYFPGGFILPGPDLMAAALHEHAARLPKVRFRSASRGIGRSTANAIRSGTMLGAAGAVRELVRSIRSQYDRSFIVLATGGRARSIAPLVPEIDFIVPHLVLYGLFSHSQRYA